MPSTLIRRLIRTERVRSGPLFVTGLLVGLLAGCEATPLRPINRTITLAGEYCTNDSTTIGVPIRLLLVVDTSQSMETNDPGGNRGAAATRLVNGLIDKGLDVSFAFVGFDTGARALTSGFLSDPAELQAAIPGLNAIQGFTNYLDALGSAKTLINADIIQTAEKLEALRSQGVDTRYKRPWYFVVFLSDGIPRMPGGVLQSTDSILFQVDQLMEVPQEATGITLHTAFVGAQDDALRPEAEVLLKKMAAGGQGTYFSFTRGEDIDFSVFDFQIKRLFDIKQMLAYNRTSALGDDDLAPMPDSDSDGLSDEDEDRRGTDWAKPDTDGDGLGDGYEVRLALDPLKPNSICTSDAAVDSDSDGLNDCEENFLNLSKTRFDTDGDLFPDRLELLSQMNPGDAADAREDLDFDGVLSGDELRTRTKVTRSDREERDHYAFTYSLERLFNPEKGSVCYRYAVGNIGVTKTRATDARAMGVNEIVLDFIESPEDAPDRMFTLNRFVFTVDYADYQNDTLTPDTKFTPVSSQELPRN